MTHYPNGTLDKNGFRKLYGVFRNEPVTNLVEISDFIFRAFDEDNNGFITFNEFMIGFALTSKGDQKTKLEYAFDLYDADKNGQLTSQEIRLGIAAMFVLLGQQKSLINAATVADECFKQLDTGNDGMISKGKA